MLSIYANSSLDLYKLLHGWQKCPGRHWGNQQLHHPNFIVRMGINPKVLDWSQKIWNVDSTENKEGMITHYLNLEVETKGILSCHGRDILLTWYKSTTRNMALRVWFWVLVLSRSCKEQLLSFWWWVAPPKTKCLREESLKWNGWGMEFLLGGDILTSTVRYKEVKSGAFGTQKAWLIYYWGCTKNSKVHVISDIIL